MIVSAFDARAPEPEVRQMAITLPDQIQMDDLLQVMGVHRECTMTPPTLRCTAWHRDTTLQRGVPLPGRSGISILMQISDPPVVIPVPMDIEDNDEIAALQMPSLSTKRTLKLEHLLPESPKVIVDFTAAAEAYSALMNVHLDFLLDWPTSLDFPEETNDALASLHQYEQGKPIQAMHFYVDGSKVAGHEVGAATICLLETAHELSLAGVLPVHVQFAEHAYIGEHAAMVHALIWAVQFSTWHLQTFPGKTINFHFNFDAMNTGCQAAGWWRAHEHREWQTLFRSLAHILEHRHGARHVVWTHVRAHTHHPWNEMADRVAKYASMNPQAVGTCGQWHHWLSDPALLNAFQWIWYLETMRSSDPTAAPLHGLLLEHTVMPPHVSDLPDPENAGHNPQHREVHIDIKFATANILTLPTNADTRCTSIHRQQILMRQFHEARCHIVGLQETRHQHLQDVANPYYHMVGAPANKAGQDGVQLWISKTLPLSEHGLAITSKEIKIIEASSTYLIVKVETKDWHCTLITARAPHSGHGLQQAEQFWHRISSRIRQLSRTWPVFFLGDTNGHLGDEITDAVGGLHARKENDAGTAFHHWLIDQNLFAPATFSQYHAGAIDYTYVSPDGDHCTRIDYIALPQALHYDSICTWVEEDIDITTWRLDHLPVLCHITLTVTKLDDDDAKYRRTPRRILGSDASFCRAMQNTDTFHALHEGIQMPPWCCDPHATADVLATQTQHVIQKMFPRIKRSPRKTHLSEETWDLVCHKKYLFKQLRALKRARVFTQMQAIFHAWRQPQQNRLVSSWMKLNDHAVAITMKSLGKTTRQVTEAVRAEDRSFYHDLAQQAAHTYSVEGLTALWRRVKAVLPKHRLRRSVQRYDLGDALLQHFEHLEAGTTSTAAEVRHRCLDRNVHNVEHKPGISYIDLSELPTLAETEDLCLRQRPHKAPGPDGLSSNVCRYGAAAVSPHLHGVMLKAFLSAMEPCRYKGGYLVPIWKQKGPQHQADSYRGILLSETYGKVYHAWLRRRLLPTMLTRKALGQLGGLPSQQTTSGIQMLRLHGRLGRARKISTAVIFVDLRSAFHHLLREFIFTEDSPMKFEELRKVLDPMDFDLKELAADLHHATLQRPSDMPPALRKCLADVHRSTWFQLQPDSNEATETRRGTRPGSPLADIGFNLLMAKLVQLLRDQLHRCPLHCQGQTSLGIEVPPITWVDDLAVPLAATRPEQLQPLVQEVIAMLHTTFQRFGLSLNMQKGKTEVVLMYRGRDANSHRSVLFDAAAPPTIVTTTSTHVLSLRVVPSYRHLGARYTMDIDIHEEIASRMAMAKQAFAEMRKAIFGNQALAPAARTTLYESLVLSRLLY